MQRDHLPSQNGPGPQAIHSHHIGLKFEITRFDVYETLCPQQMLVYKCCQIKNSSGECRDAIPTKLQCQLFKEHFKVQICKGRLFEKKQKNFFFKFSPNNLLIILYQLTKFEAPNWYSFRHIMITNFQSPNRKGS